MLYEEEWFWSGRGPAAKPGKRFADSIISTSG